MSDVIKVKPFDGLTDYSMWKHRMLLILVKEKVDVAITKECPFGIAADLKKETQRLAITEVMM